VNPSCDLGTMAQMWMPSHWAKRQNFVKKYILIFAYPKSGKKHSFKNIFSKSESNINIEFQKKLKSFDPT
jgi:hypothetical protein